MHRLHHAATPILHLPYVESGQRLRKRKKQRGISEDFAWTDTSPEPESHLRFAKGSFYGGRNLSGLNSSGSW
jgi:hypothetical protein